MSAAVQPAKAALAAIAVPSHQPPAPQTSQSVAEPRGYLGDWLAMILWTSCFGLMAIIHVVHLIVGMFR
jgi:hypothetical protein